MDKTWKAKERKIAKKFGVKRTPLSGSNAGGTRSDTLHERLYIEIKTRKELPKMFSTLMEETIDKAIKENKIPVVAISEKGQRGCWFVIHSSDLEFIAKELKNG